MEELLNGYFLQVLTFVCINIILAMTIYMRFAPASCRWAMQGS